MKTSLLGWIMVLLLAPSLWAQDELDKARELLQENHPNQAAATVKELMQQQPNDPWLRYNLGVTAYAAKNYAEADRIWQDLATTQLPRSLWKQVWTQLGNVAFRLGEPYYESAPEQTVELWERSCEAYRVVLSESRHHSVARPNLELVEAKLAKLKVRLGDQLAQKAQKQSLEPKIENLQAALDYYQEAKELTPTDSQIEPKIEQTDRQLRESLNELAAKQEKQGDQNFASRNSWSDHEAEKHYQEALSNFDRAAFQEPQAADQSEAQKDASRDQQSAQQTSPEKTAAEQSATESKAKDSEIQKAEEGTERVTDKLADLYARMGRQQQQEGDQQAQNRPEQAVEDYQEALADFDQALALNPQHEDAQRGEEEVRQALEQLHIREGRQEMATGMHALQQKNQMRAVGELSDALHDFQEAQALNAENQEAQTNIEKLQEILPDLLTAVGEQERQEAAKAEPRSIENAVEHLERAEASFDRALAVQPEHQPAQTGLEQTQADLNRLRQQIAAQLEQQAQQRRNAQRQQANDRNAQRNQQPSQQFDEMLADLNQDEAQQQYEQNRLRGNGRSNPNQRKVSKTW